MSKQTTLIQAAVAAVLFAVGAAHAAPQEVVKLPRVVITGKSAPAADVKVVQLPRVVITGYSLATQLQQQTLAAAQPRRTPHLKFGMQISSNDAAHRRAELQAH